MSGGGGGGIEIGVLMIIVFHMIFRWENDFILHVVQTNLFIAKIWGILLKNNNNFSKNRTFLYGYFLYVDIIKQCYVSLHNLPKSAFKKTK